MLRKLLFCAFVLAALPAMSQTTAQFKADSIKLKIATEKRHDTALISSYSQLSYLYSSLDPKTAIAYADTTLQWSERLMSERHRAMAYIDYGHAYSQMADNDKAMRYYAKAEAEAKRIGEAVIEAEAKYYRAYLYSIMGEYKKAVGLQRQTVKLLLDNGKKRKAVAAINSIGSNYFYLGDYDKALEYYLQSLKIAESFNDNIKIGNAYENIGLVYKRIDKNQSAFGYFEKSIKHFETANYEPGLINVLTNYGNARDQAGQPEEALRLYQRALPMALKGKNRRAEMSLLSNIAIVQQGLKNYGPAIDGLHKTIAFFRESNDRRNLSIMQQYLAETLLEAPDEVLRKSGINPAGKLETAAKMIRESLEYCLEMEALDDEAYLRELLSRIYERQGRYKEALLEHRAFKNLQDSIHGKETHDAILTKDLQYQAEKQQMAAMAEIKRQKIIKYAVMAGCLLVLLAGVILFIGYRKRRKLRETQREILLRANLSEVEMKALRLQLNPHFIFNSLNSISDYIWKNDVKTADYFLSKFAKLMRATLENSEKKEIPLAEELEMLEWYLQLESARLREKFTYEIKVDPDIDPNETYVPPLILQPFVENSIWHGIAKKTGTGRILIQIGRENKLLNCIVEDDGIGRKTAGEGHPHVSFGIANIRDRIAILNKLKNTNGSLNLIDLEQGTRVEVKLPFEHDL